MQWISVKDRMPEANVEILTYGEEDGVCTAMVVWFEKDGSPYFMCRGTFRVTPSHWMPLPEGPK